MLDGPSLLSKDCTQWMRGEWDAGKRRALPVEKSPFLLD